jgi:NAD(P)-dependent dehydrogenase (short-subunit alcohol dehydrogenase family)
MSAAERVVVTGAASGIGRALARRFASSKYAVLMLDASPNVNIEAAALQEDGARVVSAVVDVTDYAQVDGAVSEFARTRGGAIDILINCAGIAREGRFEDIPIVVQRKTVEVNLIGAVNVIHACLLFLKKGNDAHIVQIASSTAFYGLPDFSVYGATKAAVRCLTESLDLELEPYGIRVWDFYPPAVATPMVLDQETPAAIHSSIVAARVSPESVADAIFDTCRRRRVPTHYIQDWGIWCLHRALGLMPFIGRPVVKMLTMRKGSAERGAGGS